MAKINKSKNEHHNLHFLGEVIHHMEHGVVAAYDWLSGPAMSEKERVEHKLAETEAIRRSGSFGF
ncbi:MAG: hypothetical protein FI717_03000 [SAR202 cluster bacterium]|nr:hypothetical protein [Chloroflexota bacterium]MBS34237.1 hypothetical protein [Verrucomicrobiales bacterium]MQF94523.1 hypothetical protein [SAR202 cluster bacterium]HAA95441.1 hypothetical protein [Dehalococcoidia bacterium]MQG33255.1 hypothetical protein [SAR202 cluster bacterium]